MTGSDAVMDGAALKTKPDISTSLGGFIATGIKSVHPNKPITRTNVVLK